MPSDLTPAEFYHREAARLRSMAASPIFHDVRDGLLRMAAQYVRLAAQAAGRPTPRDRPRDDADGRLGTG